MVQHFSKKNVKKCKINYNLFFGNFCSFIRCRWKIFTYTTFDFSKFSIDKIKRIIINSFNPSQNNNSSSLSVSEAYKILNLDISKKPTKELVNKAYQKIQKKIHPDVSPETTRLSAIVNEAKEIVLKDIS